MLRYVGWVLKAIGVLALLAIAYIAWHLFVPAPANRNPVFVLNWTGVDSDQRIDVVYSEESPPQWMGDYSSIYCLQIEKFKPAPSAAAAWVYGSDTNDIFAMVRRDAAQEEIGRCFGRALDANATELAVFIWRVELFGRNQIEGADVIFYDAETRRLLYTGFQN
jgi:hypothetical protein